MENQNTIKEIAILTSELTKKFYSYEITEECPDMFYLLERFEPENTGFDKVYNWALKQKKVINSDMSNESIAKFISWAFVETDAAWTCYMGFNDWMKVYSREF